jgi:protein TonB
MDFARQQRDPTRHLIGIAFVILLHVLIVWGMVSGLARKAVEVIKKPITATIIEEIKIPPPPPPPPKKIEPPPKVQAPPPPQQPYVPPPEVQVTPPPTPAPTISVAPSPEPPKQEYKIEPPAPPAPPPPVAAPPAPKPAVRRGVVPVSREDPVYPRAAIRAGVEKGRVLARVNIDEKGNVTEVIIVSAEPPRHFDNAVREALSKWRFQAEGEKYVGEIEVIFTLRD